MSPCCLITWFINRWNEVVVIKSISPLCFSLLRSSKETSEAATVAELSQVCISPWILRCRLWITPEESHLTSSAEKPPKKTGLWKQTVMPLKYTVCLRLWWKWLVVFMVALKQESISGFWDTGWTIIKGQESLTKQGLKELNYNSENNFNKPKRGLSRTAVSKVPKEAV